MWEHKNLMLPIFIHFLKENFDIKPTAIYYFATHCIVLTVTDYSATLCIVLTVTYYYATHCFVLTITYYPKINDSNDSNDSLCYQDYKL